MIGLANIFRSAGGSGSAFTDQANGQKQKITEPASLKFFQKQPQDFKNLSGGGREKANKQPLPRSAKGAFGLPEAFKDGPADKSASGKNFFQLLLKGVGGEGLDNIIGDLGLDRFDDVFLLGFGGDHEKGNILKVVGRAHMTQ